MDRSTMLERLRESGLLNEQQLEQATRRLGEGETTQERLKALISDGLLTDYQAKRLWANRGRGLVLGQYHILDELGRGGFGQVFKARHTVMDRIVALKVIAPELVDNERARTWFQREVLTVTQLYHPNIVMAYDAQRKDDTLFFVMEYVQGSNLDAAVQKQGPLPIGVACEMMRQAAEALQYAHEKGMVHRDIKPANLLLPQQSSAPSGSNLAPSRGAARPSVAQARPVLIKIVDFGLALLQDGGRGSALTQNTENKFLGTPDYVAPEQARNPLAADIRSDLYSLGCTFYYALTGRRPFKADTARETLARHLEMAAEPLESLRAETPPAVCAIIRRLMAKDPARRFQTPADMIAELNFLNEPEGVARSAKKSAVLRLPGRTAAYNPYAKAKAQTSKEKTAGEISLSQVSVAGESCNTAGLAPSVALASCPSIQSCPEPVNAVGPVGSIAEMRRGWQQWTSVVDAAAQPHKMAKVDAQAYALLHKKLMQMCRSRQGTADTADEGYARLQALLEPWLTAEALLSADRSTLASLRQSCRKIERELGWGPAGGSGWLWPIVVAAGVVAAVASWQLQQHAKLDSVNTSFLTGLWKTAQTRPLLGAAVAVPVAVAASICGFTRWLRR